MNDTRGGSTRDEPLKPTDVDPSRFNRLLWIYFIGGILAITAWQYWRHRQESAAFEQADRNQVQIERDFQRVRSAIVAFREDQGREPRNLRELVGFGELTEIPNDPWSDRPYRYWIEQERFGIYTLGADQVEGGERWNEDLELRP